MSVIYRLVPVLLLSFVFVLAGPMLLSIGGSNDGLPDVIWASPMVDTDGDGEDDSIDLDDDNDGVRDGDDWQPLNPWVCRDVDNDGCDDCSVGNDGYGPLRDYDPFNDGIDLDGDGLCDAGDPDDDNDGVADHNDPVVWDPYQCGDQDGDWCDDCSVGNDGYGPLPDYDVNNDGVDTDGDGLCDAGDPDDDDDGILDWQDNCPLTYNPNQEDSDNDGIGDHCEPVPIEKRSWGFIKALYD